MDRSEQCQPGIQANEARAEAREPVATLEHGNAVAAVAFSPDGDLLATGGGMWANSGGTAVPVENHVRLWDATA